MPAGHAGAGLRLPDLLKRVYRPAASGASAMRYLVLAIALTCSPPALAQALNASLAGSLNGLLFGGLQGGVASGFSSEVGPRQGPLMPGQTFEYRDFTAERELERLGFTPGACAPSQLDLNHTGCRSIREFSARSASSYDLSIQAMGQLPGQTLQGVTLDIGPGPAGQLD